MPRLIEVVEYDPSWVTNFEQEATMLTRVFGKRILEIHHIGSTAVPGLYSKPIIDVLIVLDDTTDIDAFNPTMKTLGYRARGECLDAPVQGTPGRFYFSKDMNGIRSHQVHVCAKGHQEILDKLAFRDYLRGNRSTADAYGEIKRRAAADHPFDIVGYINAKDQFVKSTLLKARLWHEGRPFQSIIETSRTSGHSCLSVGNVIRRTGLPPTFCSGQ